MCYAHRLFQTDLAILEDIQDEGEALDAKEDMDAEPVKKDEVI